MREGNTSSNHSIQYRQLICFRRDSHNRLIGPIDIISWLLHRRGRITTRVRSIQWNLKVWRIWRRNSTRGKSILIGRGRLIDWRRIRGRDGGLCWCCRCRGNGRS
ncbi:hypothetical protein PFISCL1PPCAC_15430 [Pristionchus fissidentatus]|uniref:Uncharacterized protein n=1 Tax=Pristionchus fissidentatus TaxID=1538716 RepID=A0AAV5W0X9_9BILA|nr:hypothetical protein PFISCL1PPCAC_15430 [Pristionchus fissidentatus]